MDYKINNIPIKKGQLVRLVNYQHKWHYNPIDIDHLEILGVIREDGGSRIEAFSGENLGRIAVVTGVYNETVHYKSCGQYGMINAECVVPLFKNWIPTIALWRRLRFTKQKYIDGLINKNAKGII